MGRRRDLGRSLISVTIWKPSTSVLQLSPATVAVTFLGSLTRSLLWDMCLNDKQFLCSYESIHTFLPYGDFYQDLLAPQIIFFMFVLWETNFSLLLGKRLEMIHKLKGRVGINCGSSREHCLERGTVSWPGSPLTVGHVMSFSHREFTH